MLEVLTREINEEKLTLFFQTLASLWLAALFVYLLYPVAICSFICGEYRCQYLAGGYSFWAGPTALDALISVAFMISGLIIASVGAWKHALAGVVMAVLSALTANLYVEANLSSCSQAPAAAHSVP